MPRIMQDGKSSGFGDSLRRIVVIRTGNFIGDVVITTPVLDALRQHYPEAFISLVADMPGAALMENHPSLDEVIVYRQADRYRTNRMRTTLKEHWDTFRRIRAGAFDSAFVLHPQERAALLGRFSAAPLRVGFSRGGYNDSVYRSIYSLVIPWPEDDCGRNQSDRLLDAVRAIGLTTPPPRLSLAVNPEAFQSILPLVQRLRHPRVALHTGPKGQSKSWTVEGWREVVKHLREAWNASVIFVGSEREQASVQDVIPNALAGVYSAAGGWTLKETAALLSCVDVFVGVDSGPLHVAAAVGCPTVMLSGPTDARRWNPVGGCHLAVRAQPFPCPCCDCKKEGPLPCMEAISAESVIAAVNQLLKQSEDSPLRSLSYDWTRERNSATPRTPGRRRNKAPQL
ncbi:MAG: glycosyltransferase family 9 protein [Armatimonadetes bacterium]|nr:glycosyltransferase family 9 protein [Armatimonadota bacterium]